MRPFACDTCTATFAYAAALRRHKKAVHEGKRHVTGLFSLNQIDYVPCDRALHFTLVGVIGEQCL